MRVPGFRMRVRGFRKRHVPYMPGMGWRIMDVIDPDNEVKKFLEAIEKQDYIQSRNYLEKYLHDEKNDLG